MHKDASLIFNTPKNQSYFFGYYNYSPINMDGNKMLAHRAFFEGRLPTREDKVEIGYFDLVTGSWEKVSESRAFNWQQGSMLQWLGPDFNARLIFNDFENEQFVARIFDLRDKSIRTIPHAIYGIDPRGEFSITLKFERSYWARAYKYACVANEKWNKNIPESDGIFRVELQSGKVERIIDLQHIVELSGKTDNVPHWLEHIMLNPEGDRFAFYHPYGSNLNFFTKVLTADIDGGHIWQQPYNNGDRYSHLGWKNSAEYTVYTMKENKALTSWKKLEMQNNKTKLLIQFYRALIKPLIPKIVSRSIIRTGNNFSMVHDKYGIINRIDPVVLPRDGHPSFTKNGRFMLTDTYEDKNNFRHLLIYDFLYNKTIKIGKFYSAYNSCGWRADLHPRFSHDEKYIIIDSTTEDHHQIIVLKLNNDIDKLK